MYPFYLGIDLHLKRTYMVLMDAKGEIINKGRISIHTLPQHFPFIFYRALWNDKKNFMMKTHSGNLRRSRTYNPESRSSGMRSET